jgi:hypothetical protein
LHCQFTTAYTTRECGAWWLNAAIPVRKFMIPLMPFRDATAFGSAFFLWLPVASSADGKRLVFGASRAVN